MTIKINLKDMKVNASFKDRDDIFFSASQIITDSRAIKENQLFVPLKGENFDGHEYIDKALKKNASACLYDPCAFNPESTDNRLYPVVNTRRAYQELSYLYRKQLHDTKIIALTGSSGKTTLKEILKLVLSEYGKTYATEKNFNNEIGVPKTLLSIEEDTTFGVVEMGARHLGDISPLVKITSPDVVILTGVGSSHIGEFGSLENIYKTKLEILKDSAPGNLKIGPEDDPLISDVLKKYPNHITVGKGEGASIRIVSTKSAGDGMECEYLVNGSVIKVSLPFYHYALPINVGYVLATCHGLGMDLSKCLEALSTFIGLEGRYQLFQRNGKSFVDDAYNANHDSMIMGLKSFHTSFDKTDSVLVLGDMLELGIDSKSMHEKVGAFVASNFKHAALVTVGPESKAIADGAEAGGFDISRIKKYPKYEDLLSDLESLLNSSDCFYFKSSNGTGLHHIVKKIKDSQ
ncbi:UDP-N-acetylmuramoyl-tripeptide--D-alanyl-D-alanine ligase [bacterium]|nr:UDP-N-acetylmuramoyl-tripeptide--D-alanyl-D-alanine ligase [bacterium]